MANAAASTTNDDSARHVRKTRGLGTFKPSVVTRAIRAIQSAGATVRQVEITNDKMVFVTSIAGQSPNGPQDTPESVLRLV